jgi:hypothetical protein
VDYDLDQAQQQRILTDAGHMAVPRAMSQG